MTYASITEFHRAIAEHADSRHYIVNHELYQQLAHQGELQSFAQQGIEILDGGFSNSDLHEHAQNALSHIHHAVDSGGMHIPVIGLFLYGLKSTRNVRQFFNREQTGNELAANLIGDGVGLEARTGAGFLGWQVGASIGTMIAPGIGTVIGAGITGLIASLSAGSFVSMLAERWKYGDILEAQGLIGDRYLKQFPPEALEQLQERVYRVPEVERALRMELPLLDDYRN
ncbi:hypothetical protein [Kyrpidia spormannii]|uniref:Uncharacterized protein n=1 Tax=Kyrpidia spormannii TaxID=2055160 RepID=A0ACA8ZD56_9BACL|nr:hypothetical protein [Kyrpidia spormannii]CAB3395034.1 conserved protein of unknown function [Kyrpidia spormannii]